jgi:hypothetical protein
MSLELRRRHVPPELHHAVEHAGPPPATASEPADSRNVTVTTGIHRGRFPIGGMQIRQARNVLRRLVPIDDEAVAVINGRAVSDDEIIAENVTQISFVKPSAIKG